MSKHGSMFRISLTITLVLIIVTYAIFNSRFIITGPIIEVYNFIDGQKIEGDGLIEIKGRTNNISFISLNGRQIFIDENKEFNEELLLTNKINPIEFYAKDRFGKEVRKKITLVYGGELPTWDQNIIEKIIQKETEEEPEETPKEQLDYPLGG